MLLNSKVAIVTGAGSERGIGRAIAHMFAAEGATVVGLDVDESGVLETARLLGAPHHGFRCDVRDAQEVGAVFGRIAEEVGRPSILVNNAGVTQKRALVDLSEADYDLVMDVSMRGTFLCSRAVVPHMQALGGGSIVCISSISAKNGGGLFGGAHYCAAKAAVLGFARSLARSLATDHIRVNAVAPGLIDTDITHGEMTAEMKGHVVETAIPLGRVGQPGDVAKVCLFLASDMSEWVTGEVIDVNGGQYMD